ncbi:MAG: hypothetical protein E6L00_07820 [Thaumarchaeota archaeon]|nr:MAG: hypothetical protein E6L00_07820 [Nitrososphaerota archaeon]
MIELTDIIFLIVRTASKRLPKKALLKIKNKPLIKILIDRITKSYKKAKIIVCTTNHKSDDGLVKFLIDNNIEVFRGDNKNILKRLYLAAKKFMVEQFVVVEGDDVFCEPMLMKETYRQLRSSKYEFVVWENLPFGVSPMGIKTSKLGKLIKIKDIRNTETGWGEFIIKSKLFKTRRLKPADKTLMRPEIRLSVDYLEDYKLAKKIYRHMPQKFSLKDIIIILDKNPQWLKINESVKSKYVENFEKQVKMLYKSRNKI